MISSLVVLTDNLSNVLVKVTEPTTTSYLFEIINNSFQLGRFLNHLLKAKVEPLYTSGSRLDEDNYRPLLLLVWSKIFEKVMYNRVYYYFEVLNLFHSKLFGFRKKHSCVIVLAEMTERITRGNWKTC